MTVPMTETGFMIPDFTRIEFKFHQPASVNDKPEDGDDVGDCTAGGQQRYRGRKRPAEPGRPGTSLARLCRDPHPRSLSFRPQAILNNQGKKFWETPASTWDDINNVGLRGHYICSVYAAQMMVEAKRGLIVVISSMGGLRYIFNVAYGVGKAACDRLAADCAHELRRDGVSYVSLWPGAVRTETITELIINREVKTKAEQQMVDMFTSGETPEMSGKCIVALATDKNLMKKSGKVLMTCDLAAHYGIKDVDGRTLVDYRSVKFLLRQLPGLSWLAPFIPGFIKVPKWVLALAANKF
ncbi:dehydrogenase/reductase SDR family member 1 [Carcharodon carcharias]|uniref:dehydrogenase/reductase SDR family member 1 n=1 Tax=Carcharodon carcharias TaxID=13397 RepID=UPI001B7EBD23|nr:dehydrogenase/reductase SDR family member 1 [Carcharodon carcharias]